MNTFGSALNEMNKIEPENTWAVVVGVKWQFRHSWSTGSQDDDEEELNAKKVDDDEGIDS